VPGLGVVVEGIQGVKYATMPPKIYENGKKIRGFQHFFLYIATTPFFAQ
jgi:hypothetical protein